MTPALLEQLVLSKPYFDRHGLMLAAEGKIPIGFVHVGFGPDKTLSDLNMEVAVISMLMVSKSGAPDQEMRLEVARSLVKAGEDFAMKKGAKTIFAGEVFPNNPFYLGLYGGSRLPGILQEDVFTSGVLGGLQYRAVSEYGIWQRELAGFRTIVNREQMQIRRNYNIRAEFDPSPRSWWEACTLGHAERVKFGLFERSTDFQCGEVTFWDIQPLANHWGVQASGMFDILIDPGHRRSGLATFLIGEALRQLKEHGVTIAEVQADRLDANSIGLFEKIGFKKIDSGVLYSKHLGARQPA
ncbi:MAG: GNAT family N-acetyltransferase [Planctomycetota bacterium]|nr:GNAT family N-acetyltransferase [Planctomycetota bacterium]